MQTERLHWVSITSCKCHAAASAVCSVASGLGALSINNKCPSSNLDLHLDIVPIAQLSSVVAQGSACPCLGWSWTRPSPRSPRGRAWALCRRNRRETYPDCRQVESCFTASPEAILDSSIDGSFLSFSTSRSSLTLLDSLYRS